MAVRRQRLQVEQAKRLEQRRTLTPGAAGIDIDALDRDPLGRLHRHPEGGEVVGREQAAVLAMVLDDGRCDVAPIEGGTGGGEARGTVAAGGALLIRHVLEGAPEIGLHEDIADGRRAATGQVDRRVGRPAGVVLRLLGDDARHQRVHDEAVAREPDRGLGHLAEGHGSVAFERGDPGVRRGRRDGTQQAHRDVPVVLTLEEIGRHRGGPGAEAADGLHLPRLRAVEDDRRDAPDIDEIAVHDAQGDARGHTRVDGIAARLQDREARLGSQIVTGDDGVPMAADHRPERVDRLGVERRVFASASAHGYSWLAR